MESISYIIAKCLKGNETACKTLYQQFLPYSYNICKRYGVKDAEVKDQLQIIFSAMFKSLSKFDANKASFKTWFTRICINKIIDQRRALSSIGFKMELTGQESELSYDESESLNGKLDKEYILKVLDKMPSKYRIVFNLFIMDDYSHKEISEKLNISIGSSRIILKRGRSWAKENLTNFLNHV